MKSRPSKETVELDPIERKKKEEKHVSSRPAESADPRMYGEGPLVPSTCLTTCRYTAKVTSPYWMVKSKSGTAEVAGTHMTPFNASDGDDGEL